MAYNTGNQPGSTSPKDLIDNAEDFDYLMTGAGASHPNRLGVPLKSWKGMEEEFSDSQADKEERFQQFLLSSGYEPIGEYGAGLLLNERNQIFLKDGEYYRASAALVLPYTTTGVWADESAKFVSVGDAALRQELVSPTGSKIVWHRDPTFGSVARPLNELLAEAGLSVETFGGVAGGIVDASAAFATLEASVLGRQINLNGRTYLVTAVPVGNSYTNGFFKVAATTYDADQSATTIGSATDTGGIEPAYIGGTNNTPTVSGRSTLFNRALIACSNSRAMFVRSALAACIYTWVKGNAAFAAAARQCIVNGPQASAISSEECQSYGFRAVHYGSVFCKAMVSTGGSFVSRLGNLAGSYVGLFATNTCRIGKGRNASLQPVVVGGAIVSVNILDGGIGYDLTTASLLFTDRSATGSGATGNLVLDGFGTITGVNIAGGGANYSANTECMVDQTEAQAAIIGSELCVAHTGKNMFIGGSLNTTVSGPQAAAISSDTCTASGPRASTISSTGSDATGSGSVVIGATNSKSIADRAVALGRRVIADLAGSFVIGDALAGVAATLNKIFQVAASGNVTAKGTFTGNTIYVDYAEYFENLVSGVALSLGLIVTLKGRKICAAQEGDYILGVISGTALIRAGDSPLYWSKRHMTGRFGEPLFEQIEVVSWPGVAPYDGELSTALAQGLKVPSEAEHSIRLVPVENLEIEELQFRETEWVVWQGYEGFNGSVSWCEELELKIPEGAVYSVEKQNVENPDFDPTQPNIPRSERPNDWGCVGVMGQVHVRVAADVTEGVFLKAIDGVGHPSDTETRLLCMEIKSPFDPIEGCAVALCFIR